MSEIYSILEPEIELFSKLEGTENPAGLKARILDQLSHWVEEYSVRFFENPWSAQEQGVSNPLFQKWAGKLWSVWKYHWEDAQNLKKRQVANIDLFQVAGSLEQGTGYQGQGELGGNPLEDTLLVDAIIEGEAVAHQYFQKTYSTLAEFIPCGQDLWQDFYLTHLLEKKPSNGLPAIAGYQGHAGLKRWVVVAFRRFVSRQTAREQKEQGIKISESQQIQMLLGLCTEKQIEAYEQQYQINETQDKQPLPRIRERISWLLQIVSEEQKLKHQYALQNLKQIQPYEEHQSIQQMIQTTPQIDARWTGCIELLGALVLKLINSFSTVDSLILKLRFLEDCKLADMERI
ncbi:MAG: hypothetical protein KDA74_12975, partial [Planctomycetaceae bacterium]|nr:hypothetical protein [Planctomycetaceae bacterium]